jgi:SH3-like domain-containing protein
MAFLCDVSRLVVERAGYPSRPESATRRDVAKRRLAANLGRFRQDQSPTHDRHKANDRFTLFSPTWLSRLSPPRAFFCLQFLQHEESRAVSEIRTRFATLLIVAQIFGASAATPAFSQEVLAPGSFKAYAAEGVEARVSDFSGLPVPRYSSLRYDEVNGRAGPSRDYPVQWTYERVGLPVIIVRESQDWRKIRDPLGDEVWVNKSQLAGERTVITVARGGIRRTADSKSDILARFEAGAILQLVDCRSAWCRVEAEGRKGWVLRSELWGVDELPSAAAAK